MGLKNITELPVAESADNINLIVHEEGTAKQIPASSVGAQADWDETDETSPAFIMNKPESLGGGSAVSYAHYGLGYAFYDKDGNTITDITAAQIIDQFHKGTVRFLRGFPGENSWGTMVGYYYYGAYFCITYIDGDSTSIDSLQTDLT